MNVSFILLVEDDNLLVIFLNKSFFDFLRKFD